MKLSELIPFEQMLEEDLRDPEFRAEWERLAPAREVANRLIGYRADRGLTQTALARLLGMLQPAVARLETGDHLPTLQTLLKLAEALDLEILVTMTPPNQDRNAAAPEPRPARNGTGHHAPRRVADHRYPLTRRSSAMTATPIWGIHAGRDGVAEDLFINGDLALCWYQTRDLSRLPPIRDAFKARVAEVEDYSGWSSAQIANIAGQLFRFVEEMQPGDLVVWRSKVDGQIRIGRVSGPYRYISEEQDRCPHQRTIRWFKTVTPDNVSEDAKKGTGMRQTLARVRKGAGEWRSIAAGDA